MQNTLRIGVSLQVTFFILFFGAILPKVNNIFGADLEKKIDELLVNEQDKNV